MEVFVNRLLLICFSVIFFIFVKDISIKSIFFVRYLSTMQENVPVKAGLLELLRNSQGKQFIIPAYQRNYTWTAKNEVKQLLDDFSR